MQPPLSPPEDGTSQLPALLPGTGSLTASGAALPAILASAGEDAITRFIDYFTAHIRNPHTRRAYLRNALAFLRWCEQARRISSLKDVKPITVAAYVEQLQQTHSKPTVKQNLATIRMLFDWLVTGQVVPSNPAHAVRGPKHVVKEGKTPVLSEEETRALFKSFEKSSGSETKQLTVVEQRDRALIATMFFTFARVGAVVAMSVDDYYPQGKRYWLRFDEKNGNQHQMPAHHTLEDYLDAYIKAAGIAEQRKSPLFRSATRRGNALTAHAMRPADVWRMVQRRAAMAGVETSVCCHSFRATGITNYLNHKGTLEKAQAMAAHSSPRTTKLYDRTNDQVSLDEVEKITL